MTQISVFLISVFLIVFSAGHEDSESSLDSLVLKSDAGTDVEAREGCIRGECDPAKGNCQCCGQHTYCGCFWDITWLGGCKCRTGTRATCWEKKDCPNRSSWTNKPFKPADCNTAAG